MLYRQLWADPRYLRPSDDQRASHKELLRQHERVFW
jgi:hypothetical protein